MTRFIKRMVELDFDCVPLVQCYLSMFHNVVGKVSSTPLIVYVEMDWGVTPQDMIQKADAEMDRDFPIHPVIQKAGEQSMEVEIDSTGVNVQNVIRNYVKKADAILQKNIALAKREEALKQERVKLDKEELDFIQEMEDLGIGSITTTDGYTMGVKTEYHCNINQNITDRDNVAMWLREHGGEELVKAEGVIAEDEIQAAKDMGLDVIERVAMNTQSVKAFIKSGLGLTGEYQQFEIKDLPKGLHFFQDRRIEIK